MNPSTSLVPPTPTALPAPPTLQPGWLPSPQHPRLPGSLCRQGFTLIELLVVISVISLLISILLPALSAARATAQRTACLSQIRQVGMAMIMYTENHDGWFMQGYPGASSEHGVAYPAALVTGGFISKSTVFLCPVRGTQERIYTSRTMRDHWSDGVTWGLNDQKYGLVDYGANWYAVTGWRHQGALNGTPARIHQITNPRFVLLVEAVATNGMANDYGYHNVYPTAQANGWCAWTAHDNIANTYWLDGSASSVGAARSSIDDMNAGSNVSASLYLDDALPSEWRNANVWSRTGRITD